MHLKGWGTPAAVKQAAQQWEASAKLGHLLAGYNLAMLHLGGQTGRGAGGCAAAVALLKGVAERGFPAQQVGAARGGAAGRRHAHPLATPASQQRGWAPHSGCGCPVCCKPLRSHARASASMGPQGLCGCSAQRHSRTVPVALCLPPCARHPGGQR